MQAGLKNTAQKTVDLMLLQSETTTFDYQTVFDWTSFKKKKKKKQAYKEEDKFTNWY